MKPKLTKFLLELALMLTLTISSSTQARAAAPIPLRAGPLSMVFEPDNAFLRYVKLGPHEVLRGIYAPVRNQVWGTVRPVVTNLNVQNKGDHFSLTFDAVCREREIDFMWRGSIEGRANGEIEFTFDGTARSTFQRNRIGFCVLHGPSAAGQPWIIENVRGEKSKGRFPIYIAPHQPAKEIREIAHELAPDLWARVRMEGEVFEMEDQRNWTDASFKTYCTPLEIPYPVRISQGTKVQQKITLRLEGTVPKGEASVPGRDGRTILTLAHDQSALPRIGLQVSSQVETLSDLELRRLKRLNLDHLRVDLALASDDFPRKLRQAATQSKALGVALQVGLRLGQRPDAELQRLATELTTVRPAVSVWLIIEADRQTNQLARRFLTPFQGKALIGGVHEDINFTQLNRVRPENDKLEVASYGITPQIHAFDNSSIIETLPIQGDTVRSARQFVGDCPLVISPISLRSQTVTQKPLPGELPADVDARQPTLFTAGWTLGSVKYLSEAGVYSLTYYETVGWKGIMKPGRAAPPSANFPSQPGGVFPLYHVLSEIGDFAGGRVQRVDSTDPLSVVGLALSKAGRARLLVANLTDRTQSATIQGLGEGMEARPLDLQNTLSTSQDLEALSPGPASPVTPEQPLVLPPYGIVRIERAAVQRKK